jgi:hypothetical protein
MAYKGTGIPDGITREDVIEAIQDSNAGVEHSFGPSTFYDLIHDGERYPPKAILGLAARRLAGRTLEPNEFSGGQGSKCFKVLEGLGFEIVEKRDAVAESVDGSISGQEASRVFRDMLPDDSMRRSVARIFAQSISEAHEINPAAWVLTYERQEPYIRLNIARFALLSLRRGKLSVTLDKELLERTDVDTGSWESPAEDQQEFKLLPKATWRQGLTDEIVANWEQLERAHLAAVRSAATKVSRSPVYGFHQPELVDTIAEIVGQSLPQPDYGTDSGQTVRAGERGAGRVWVVRAGREGEAHEQFLENGEVAIGWNELGDLTRFESLDDLVAAYPTAFPDEPERAVGTCCREIWQFLHEIETGDTVIYPVKGEDHVVVGEVAGTARHRDDGHYKTVRPVHWFSNVSRSDFPDAQKKTLNLPLTCYEVKDPGSDSSRLLDQARTFHEIAVDFVRLGQHDDDMGREIRRHREEHHKRHHKWAEVLGRDAADPEELLACLKDTDWYEGAKKTTAPDAVETQEKADDLLGRFKDIMARPPRAPTELQAAIDSLPSGFSIGFISEFLTYVMPEQYWELNSPVRETIKLLGFKGWQELPHGKKNTPNYYFALEPLVKQLRSALGFAGLEDPSHLDVDLLLYEIARQPSNFSSLPIAIDMDALEKLIEDIRAYHPGFASFSDRGSSWWRDETVYKEEFIEVVQRRLGDEAVVSRLSPTELVLEVESVLSTKLPTGGGRQNLVSWRANDLLKKIAKNDEWSETYASAISDLLFGEGDSPERLQRYNEATWPVIQEVPQKYGPGWTRILPSLLLMCQRPDDDILIRTTEFDNLASVLTGGRILSDGPLSAREYRRARSFAASLSSALEEKGLRPRNMVDVQGFIHVTAARSTWILQAIPEVWDLVRFLTDGNTRGTWTLPTNADKVHEGDEVYLWVSGENRGIVAHGTVESDAITADEIPEEVKAVDERYYLKPEGAPKTDKFALYTLDKAFPDQRILASELTSHEVLRDLTILKRAQGTVFSVPKDLAVALWRRLLEVPVDGPNGDPTLKTILEGLRQQGLFFPDELVANYLLALQTKRFVILPGISGTGKTKLAISIAEHYAQQRSVEVLATTPPGWTALTVQPSYLKHSGMVVPVVISRQIDWEAAEKLAGPKRLRVEYELGHEDLAVYRDPNRDVTGLNFKRGFKRWIHDNFRAGDPILVDLVENDDGAVAGLRFARPEMTTEQVSLENHCVVAVRPDWTDHRGLLGYFNPLTKEYVRTPFLELLLRASDEYAGATQGGEEPRPFFVVLDEMNLARVEHYFSDLLSCIESDQAIHLHDDRAVDAGETEDGIAIPMDLCVPPNLFVVGTVNVDETTYMFSPKVLDRAFTIELNEVDLAGYVGTSDSSSQGSTLLLPDFQGLRGAWRKPEPVDWRRLAEVADGEYQGWLISLNDLLESEGRHFGYRVANEIGRFVCLAHDQSGHDEAATAAAFDLAVLQKVLPKLNGTQQELQTPITNVFRFAVNPNNPQDGPDPGDLTLADDGFVKKTGQALVDTEDADGGATEAPDRISPVLPRTARKLWRMHRRLRQRGFVSYIE